jgi:Arm DNA-binding domain
MAGLTACKVENAKPGGHIDGGGLMLHVQPTDAESWVLRIQSNGRRRDIGLGSVNRCQLLPEVDDIPLLEKCLLTLAEARLKATTLRQMVKAGRDPVAKLLRDRTPIPISAPRLDIHKKQRCLKTRHTHLLDAAEIIGASIERAMMTGPHASKLPHPKKHDIS